MGKEIRIKPGETADVWLSDSRGGSIHAVFVGDDTEVKHLRALAKRSQAAIKSFLDAYEVSAPDYWPDLDELRAALNQGLCVCETICVDDCIACNFSGRDLEEGCIRLDADGDDRRDTLLCDRIRPCKLPLNHIGQCDRSV